MPCCSSCKHDLNSDNFRGCNRCNKSFHWECTKLNKFLIKQYKKNPYIVWWCQDCKDKYCIGCDKKFPNEQVDSIYCDRCSYWYHLSCSNLNTQEFDIPVHIHLTNGHVTNAPINSVRNVTEAPIINPNPNAVSA